MASPGSVAALTWLVLHLPLLVLSVFDNFRFYRETVLLEGYLPKVWTLTMELRQPG